MVLRIQARREKIPTRLLTIQHSSHYLNEGYAKEIG
jgi:hypothetical protein